MTLDLFIYRNQKGRKVGTIVIAKNRIIKQYIHGSFDQNKRRKGKRSFLPVYVEEVDALFSLSRLSKLELPFRNFKLTHRIKSKCFLHESKKGPFYVRLSTLQTWKLKLSQGKYFWHNWQFWKDGAKMAYRIVDTPNL